MILKQLKQTFGFDHVILQNFHITICSGHLQRFMFHLIFGDHYAIGYFIPLFFPL